MRIRLSNWRLWLMLTHRWLGIAIGLMFVAWTISGIVLMYYGLPHLTAGERLLRLPVLDTDTVQVSPEQAAARVDGAPFRIKLSMQGDRPVYRINTGRVFGRWTLVYADTGEIFEGFDADAALDWLRGTVPEAADTLALDGYLTNPDLFTHNPAMQTHMPMHRIALNDAAGTEYYVSERTGEAVMKTDRLGRWLGFLGYELHTLFFFRQKPWWGATLQVLSWTGLVMCVLGVVLGIVRFALRPRYRRRGGLYRTPYAGLMKWHHYAGLLFGVFVVTWMVSGLVSLGVIPGVVETLYTPTQIAAGARSVQGEGPPLDLEGLTLDRLRTAARAVEAEFPIKELELVSFDGAPYFIAYREPTLVEARSWSSKSALDFISATLEHPHVLVSAQAPESGAFERLTDDAMRAAAEHAMPGVPIRAASWLDEHDEYYYPRHPSFDLGLPQPVKTLPVLRVEFDDALGTWLYLTPSHGQILKFESRDRANRWGYYGLHALDFPGLYDRRPLWDIVLLVLLIGIAVLSVTTLLPMTRRLRRHVGRLTRHVPVARASARVGTGSAQEHGSANEVERGM